jgi:hypothetical protein
MSRRIKAFVFASALLVVSTALAGSGSSTVPGAWHKLPLAPFAIPQSQASVWTGRELIVIGRRPLTNPADRVAESYDPASNRWTRLAPPSDAGTVDLTGVKAVWTGKEMLACGWNAVAYNPTTDIWRALTKTLPGGIVVWTGRAVGAAAETPGRAALPTTRPPTRIGTSLARLSRRARALWEPGPAANSTSS